MHHFSEEQSLNADWVGKIREANKNKTMTIDFV